jgi:tight adherence protein C
MHTWPILLIALTLLAASLLIFDVLRLKKNMKANGRFERLLHFKHHDDSLLHRVQKLGLRFKITHIDAEFDRLLVQAGWDSKLAMTFYLLAGRVLPAVLAVLVFFAMTFSTDDVMRSTMAAIFIFAMGYVGTNMVVRWRAATVVKQISKELVPFLHMLRMLFNSGLSLEHALLVLVEDSGDLFPRLRRQLRRVINNIRGGQDQADALLHMAKSLDIQEVTDTIAMLHQVSKYGGNIQASLNQYINLVEERQLSVIREYVTKLSAKMSIVMIVFMFPALVIFIAGPGFIGLADALSGTL